MLWVLLVSKSGSEKMCFMSPVKDRQNICSKNIAMQFAQYL